MRLWKILSPKQVKRNHSTGGTEIVTGLEEPGGAGTAPFSFTCPKCFWHGNKNRELDQDMHGRLREPYRHFLIDRFPIRCRACETAKKRFQRMAHRIDAIWEETFSFETRTYKMPKLITFALPSAKSESYCDRNNQIELLKSKLKSVRSILSRNGVLGGTYIIECTSRLLPLDEGFLAWKHHAHIHMVGIAPFVPKKHFKEFCEQLLPIGLGRINYVVPRGKNARSQIASYISKYLVKDGNNSRTFGIMRRHPTKRQPPQS